MFRFCIVCCLWLLGAFDAAMAESAAERGDYLVNTIMACGNCHSPRDANGQMIKEKAFSGGLTFNMPAFIATAPNITPDRETGIGSWSDAEIKRALVEGMRPDHGRLAGVPLAAVMPVNFYKALLPDDLDAVVAYLRSVKPVRNEVADPVYKAAVRRDPYPDAESGFSKAMFADPVKHGAYLVTIGHCMECHSAWSKGVVRFQDRPRPRRQGPPAAGRVAGGNAGADRRQYHLGSDLRHRRLDRSGNQPRHHPWRCPRRADARAADGLRLLCRAESRPIWPISSPICARFRHCNDAILNQPVPPRARRLYSCRCSSFRRDAKHRTTMCNCTESRAFRVWSFGPSRNDGSSFPTAARPQEVLAGMIDTVTKPKTRVKTKTKTERPRLHKVILVNDDYTPREFVVTVLKAEFRMTEDQAHKVMITAHRRGVCVVAVFTRDVAETKATRATDAGRAKGYPLLFTTEPEE